MMKAPILPLLEIAKNYDALIFDIWGVIHDGKNPYETTVDCINQLIDDGKLVTFLSNMPRPGDLPKKKFIEFGINVDKCIIYTSGDSVREQFISWDDEVFKTLGKKVYHFGKERNEELLANLDVDIVDDVEQADFVLITLFMEEGEDLSSRDDILKKAIKLNIPAVCANPDTIVNHGDAFRYCAGLFGAKYEEFGGKVYYYGKPNPRVFHAMLDKIKALGISDKKRILMVGDTLETDILGANRVGLDSALVLTGNGQKVDLNDKDAFIDPMKKPTWISHGVFLSGSEK
jgi:HAD superfamily hydrolase (TIGR01459 family)